MMVPAVRVPQPGWRTGGERRTSFLLMAALLLALAVRLYALDHKTLSFDELYSVFVARHPLAQIITLVAQRDAHPPLFYFMLRGWMTFVGDTEFRLRLLSVLGGLLTVGLTYLLGARLISAQVGLLGAFLLAISPFHVQASQEARMYPWLAVWVWTAGLALFRWVEEGRARWLLAYGLSTLLALYTHYLAFFVLPGHVLFLARTRLSRSRLAMFAACAVGVGVLYLPWVPALLQQLADGRGWPSFRPPLTLQTLADLLGLLAFGGRLYGLGTYYTVGTTGFVLTAPLLLPFALLAAYGIATCPSRSSAWFLALGTLVPLGLAGLVSLRWNVFYSRYFSFVLPAVALALAGGMWTLAAGFADKRRALAALLVLPVSSVVPVLSEYYRVPGYGDWRAAARYLDAHLRPGDIVLFVPASGAEVVTYYLPRRIPSMALDPGEVLAPAATGPGGPLAPRRVQALAAGHPRLWIVATLPLGYPTRRRLGETLAPHFVEAWGRDFHRVYLFLWLSRRHQHQESSS
ncbi:MAG: glycosyltransferase family 39 protein [Armatimonadota bacterium]|nr:glycosyltransferase family 39 protein [Armatimonadota bacterium]MDR7488885.1 glycosyltransferase family 39 protein [Armatimonadota bacterium]